MQATFILINVNTLADFFPETLDKSFLHSWTVEKKKRKKSFVNIKIYIVQFDFICEDLCCWN